MTSSINATLEQKVIESADLITVTSEETLRLIMGPYSAALRSKALVVPHAFDPLLYPRPTSPAASAPEIVTLRYLGDFYGPRTPQPLIEALSVLNDRHPELATRLRVEVVGQVQRGMLNKELVDRLPSGLLSIRPRVGYVESLRLMRESDVLLVVDAPAALSVFLPSKLIDYIGARRPIVAITPPGAAARVAAQAEGWVASPDDPVACAEAIAGAVQWAIANPGRDVPDHDAYESHNVRSVARQIDAIISGLERDRPRT